MSRSVGLSDGLTPDSAASVGFVGQVRVSSGAGLRGSTVPWFSAAGWFRGSIASMSARSSH
ncbi:MAG TPA: hypothetical protein DCL71_01295 [Bifidobacterium sp.]|nr:hypothetical protein [Bifidobacterium sp.]